MDKSKHALITRLLSQVRSEFDRLRWQARPIRTQLVHRATNADAEGVRGNPLPLNQIVAMQGAGHREALQRCDGNGKVLFREDPIVDVHGSPITDSAGRALDVVMPAFRSVTFEGRIEDYALLAGIAKRAGRLIADLDDPRVVSLLGGWRYSTPSDLWWAFLFELAWKGEHPLLVAEKRLWLPADEPRSFVPYDLHQLNALASQGFGFANKIPTNWLKRLPDAWLSELDDVVAASVDAADYLLSELTEDVPASDPNGGTASSTPTFGVMEIEGVKIQRRFAIALSFPGERRSFVEEVANALRPALGELRVFYDKFHEAELSGPNLDIRLQRIYGEDADLVVVFVCGEYGEKEWCHGEWRAIRARMKSQLRRDEDVMFLRFDDKPLDGLLSIDGCIEISQRSSFDVADLIIRRWSATR